MRSRNRVGNIPVAVAGVLLLALLFALNFARIMGRSLDHDEHQFVTAGVMLARYGLLPYVDYAYFHAPTLVFVYALLFSETTQYLLIARSFSALCSSLLVLTVFLFAYRLFVGNAPWRRLLISVAAALVLMAAPLFLYTSGRAWNHDLPLLLAALAFLCHARALKPETSAHWFAASGLLVALAGSTRLTFAPMGLPLAAAIWFWPGGATRRTRVYGLLAFGAGALLGSLPALLFLVADPASFWFGNVEYARLNTLYRQATGYDQRMSIVEKLAAFGQNHLLYEPGNLLILAAYLRFGLPRGTRDRQTNAWLTLMAGVLVTLLIGALAPTPAWPQYYYALIPFLLLGALYGMRHYRQGWLARPAFQWAAVTALVLAIWLTGPDYMRLPRLFEPDKWNPVQFHKTGEQVVALAGPDARVLTLASALPLEGGAQIYPELTTGAFVLRAGRLAAKTEQARLRLVDPARLDEWLAPLPPHAVLTGVHRGQVVDEEPLVDYATQHGYIPLRLDEETLWLTPRAVWDDAIQLVTVVDAPPQLRAGEIITPVLLLRNIAPLRDDLNVTVRIVNRGNQVVAQSMGWPWGRPTSTWRLHEIWYDGHALHIPPDTPPDLYRLEVELYNPAQAHLLRATDLRAQTASDSPYVVTYLMLGKAQPPAFPIAPPPRFGNAVALTGYDIAASTPLRGGESVTVRLHWLPLGSLPGNYTTFVHLVGPSGELAAQHDKQPLGGFFPSGAWQPGFAFVDDFVLTLPTALAPGDYTLYVGFYHPDTGERLRISPAAQTGDHLRAMGNRLFPVMFDAPPPPPQDAWPLTTIR